MDCAPNHEGCSPDTCFAAKMRYFRENGLNVTYQQGRKKFHDGPSIRSQLNEISEGAKAGKIDPQRKDQVWS